MTIHPSINIKDEIIYLTIDLHPKSSQQKISISEDSIEIFVSSPPIKGKANKSLIKFLAKKLNLSSSEVIIVGGHKSRTKIIKVENISMEKLYQILFQND